MTYPSATYLAPLFMIAIPMALGCEQDHKSRTDDSATTPIESTHDDDDWIKVDGPLTTPSVQDDALDYAGIELDDTGLSDRTGTELNQCEANISGNAGRNSLEIQSIGWAQVDGITMFVGLPGTDNPCLPFEDPNVDLSDVGMFMGAAYGVSDGFEGPIDLISAAEADSLDTIEEELFAGFTWTPPVPEGQSSEYSLKRAVHFSEGLLTVDVPMRLKENLVGRLDVSDDAFSSLSGTFNACWCESLVELMEE